MSFAGTDSEEDGTPDHDEPAVQHDQARSGESHVGHDRQGGGPAHDVTCQRGKALTNMLKKTCRSFKRCSRHRPCSWYKGARRDHIARNQTSL